MKRLLFILSIICLTGTMLFAGGQQSGGSAAPAVALPPGVRQINEGRPITLLVDFLHHPTLNTVPTAENPMVRVVAQHLADRFMAMHPNVRIEWVRNKVGTSVDQFAEWWTTQIAGGTAPAIGATQNSAYQDRDWYWDLTSIVNTPNEYLPGNTRWKDLWPEYIWDRNSNTNINGWIQAIPMFLTAGPPTVYFYNREIFSRLGLEVPVDFEDLRNTVNILKANGYLGFMPWNQDTPYSFNWIYQFVVPPSYIYAMLDKVDYDGGGGFGTMDSLRAVKEGHFNPVTQENIREMLQLLKSVYLDIYTPGWETADYQAIWNSGNVGLKTDLLSNIPMEMSNTRRNFDYGIFPTPTVTTRTSRFVKDIPTTIGVFEPPGAPASSYNVIKPVVENNPGMLEAAVAFLKYITIPENLSEIILENGFLLGAVRGSAIPPILQEYMNQPFPTFTTQAPRAFTTEMNQAMAREMEMWVKNQINDATFFANWNRIQQQGADDYIRLNNVDISGWNIP